MTALISLFRISLQSYFGLSAMRIKYLKKKQQLWEPFLVVFGVIAGGASFGSMFYLSALQMARGAALLGQADVVLTMYILVAQMLALMFGLFAMTSIFYFSNDLDILVPLPLRAWHILATKFSLVNITEYAPVAIVLVPTLLAYHRIVGLSPVGWVGAFVTMVFVPIIPLALAGILAVTVMRGVNRRHRDILMVVASLVLLVVIFYLQYHFIADSTGQVEAEDIINNRIDFVNVVGAAFPPAVWATRAIAAEVTGERLTNLAYLFFTAALAIGAFLLVGQKVFYGGLVGGAEKVRRGIVYTTRVIERQAVQSSTAKALLLREFRLFVRMPIWLMNGFITVILFPLMAFFPAFFGATGDINSLTALARQHPEGLAIATLIAAGAIAMMTSLNTLTSTSISREGKHLWIIKSLPVDAKTQVRAKLSFALAAALLSSLPLIAVYAVLIKPGGFHLVMAFALGITAGLTPQVLGLWFDLWRPFLTWSNPQHAVKNNLNAVSPLIIMAPLGYLSYLGYMALSAGGTTVPLLVLLAAHAALALAAVIALLAKADRLYDRLEVKG
ncbi:MAG: hypothetical protein DDT36_00506 [Firmicutes bacterium]|nr:hypothetical protein [Bacillota bacterium]